MTAKCGANLRIINRRRDLTATKLDGVLDGVTALTALQTLILDKNNLTSTIPANIGVLSYLTWLSIEANHVSTSSVVDARVSPFVVLAGRNFAIVDKFVDSSRHVVVGRQSSTASAR
jgi:hypothetical protein